MCGYPQFSFWISIGLVKIYISSIITHGGKISLIVDTVLNISLIYAVSISFSCSRHFTIPLLIEETTNQTKSQEIHVTSTI